MFLKAIARTVGVFAPASGGDQGTADFDDDVAGKMPMPPETVTSAVVKEEDWAPMLSSVGSISAGAGRDDQRGAGRDGGEIEFPNGGVAKKGDVLLKLDASAEEAQLRSAEGRRGTGESRIFERARDLAARKVISKAELDAAQSKFKQKQGTVDNMQSVIDKKEMRAPFDGSSEFGRSTSGRWSRPASKSSPCRRSIRSSSILRCRSNICRIWRRAWRCR